MDTILVTGGAGYIGSHACRALARDGYTPVAYDNLIYGHPWAVKWGPLVKGDILDRAQLERAIEQYRPTAVMHFAAFAYVGESVQEPARYYRNNVSGSLALLEAMLEYGIDKFIFSSSCATYGLPGPTPFTEDHAQRPINPYGRSKLMVERIMQDFSAAYGLRSIALRYFNAAGADRAGDIGEDHDPETHLVPLVLDVAAGRRESITVFGDDYETEDGTCVRDYIHVSDLADAHVLALRALERGADSTAYNLGNGQGFSVRQVIETARRITGRDIPAVTGQRRPGDPPRLIGNADRISGSLGWSPQFPDLESIIHTAWSWHRKHFHSA
jgi:UDP-arabinose 4-epimerase